MWLLVETGVWVVPGKKRGTSASLCNSNGDSIFASVNPNFIMFRGVMMWSEVVVTQSCPTLCNTMNFGPPGSSVYGILQGRTLEWVAIPFSRGSFWHRDWIRVSCIASSFFTVWATREAQDFLCVLSVVLPIFLTYLLTLHCLDFPGPNSQIDLKCWSLQYSGNADQGLSWWLRW